MHKAPSYIMRMVANFKNGTASEQEQKTLFNYILRDLTQMHLPTYIQDSFDKTAFCAGKAWVGQMLMMMSDNQSFIERRKEEESTKRIKEKGNAL